MATTTTTPSGQQTEPGRGSLRDTLRGIDWHRYVIYIGFAVVFLFFASLLGNPSFLVTLGMLGIAVGLAQWITNSAPQPILSDPFNLLFGSGNLGPIPGLLIWTALFVVAGAIVLNKTRFGRQVLAT